MGVGGQGDALTALNPGKGPGTHCLGGGRAPGSVRTGVENFSPTGIRSPDRPAPNESLYRLNYSGPQMCIV